MAKDDEFAGMTATSCCDECAENAARGEPKCVISGADCCLHPRKSGLQAAHQMQPQVLARYDRADKKLATTDALAKVENAGRW
jgi:hypothetical protein